MPIEIPTIEISKGLDNPSIIRQLKEACTDWGFFQILGHGIDQDLRKELFLVTRQFFEQSLSAKQQVARTDTNFWGFYDRELTKNVPDWKEIFDLDANLNNNPDSEHKMSVPWPAEVPALQPVLYRWIKQCESLSMNLLRAICEAMGQPAERLDADFGRQHTSFLRLNYYPKCPNPDPGTSSEITGLLGVNRHKDAGALTVLVQDEVPALQVRKDDAWHTVIPEPEAFIVNLGDMLQVWSNDQFIAAEHRVIASADKERFSMPYFFNPSYLSLIEPLVEEAGSARYKPISWAEFRNGRAAGDYADLGEEIQIDWYRL